MRRVAIAFALLLTLAACSGDKQEKIIAEVQKLTIQICSFLPTATTVSNIISANNPVVQGVNAIAKAICDAVTANPAGVQPARFIQVEDEKPPEDCPKVNGVCIQGEFVTPKDEVPVLPPPAEKKPDVQLPPLNEHVPQ